MAQEIVIKNLCKIYDNDTIALKSLNLVVDKGKIHGLIGPNGAGKTTTLRLIMGLIKPTSGEIYIKGESVTNMKQSLKKCIGYLPQDYNIYGYFRVGKFLRFCASMYGMKGQDSEMKINKLLEFFGIKNLEDKLIQTLSRGQRQLIALLATLIHDPEILILDEPFSHLDPIMRKKAMDLLIEIHGDKAILFSSHILPELTKICRYVTIINEGVVVFSGDIDELMKESRTLLIKSVSLSKNIGKMASYLNISENDIKIESNWIIVRTENIEETTKKILKFIIENDYDIQFLSTYSLEDVILEKLVGDL